MGNTAEVNVLSFIIGVIIIAEAGLRKSVQKERLGDALVGPGISLVLDPS
jgi:hypothetical protein